MDLISKILLVIDYFKPPRSLAHNIIYLAIPETRERFTWRLTVTGLFSEELDEIIMQLIRQEKLKVCEDASLTRDHCPSNDISYKLLISKAIEHYLSMKYNLYKRA